MSLSFLQSFGLTDTESTIYELLLNLGESPAGRIVQESKLKRPTVYKALYSLEKKKLVTKKDNNKVIQFRPAPPTDILERADKQFTELERARADLQSLLPTLASQYVQSVERPIVRIFEGIEGIKKAHREILSEKKQIDAYVMINEDLDAQLNDFWQEYYRIRRREHIFARVITPNSKGAKEYQNNDVKQLRETRLVPYGKFDIKIEKNICGNKVAFFSSEGNTLIATIIENAYIANTERAIFELAWEQAEHFDDFLKKPAP